MEEVKVLNVYQSTKFDKEIIKFWQSLNALPSSVSAQDRVGQVVCIVRIGNKIVGVSTAHRVQISQLNKNYFYNYRLMLHPEYRLPGLTEKVGVSTINILEDLFKSKNTDCIGMITLVENTAYKTHRKQAVWMATGFVYVGNSANGHHLRVRYFEGASI